MLAQALVEGVVLLAFLVSPALAQRLPDLMPPTAPGCMAVVRFVNSRDGTPDPRFGVRLNVEGSAYAVVPSDVRGEVRLYVANSAPVAYSVVPL